MTTYRRWTRSAIGCYLRGCQCEGCEYEAFFRKAVYKCKMRDAVLSLVREYGAPTRSMLEDPQIDDEEDEGV